MPIAAIGVGLGTALAGAATGGAAAISAGMQSRANSKAAQSSNDAAIKAAEIQAQSQREALAAAKEQQDYERWLTSATADARKPYMEAIASAIGGGAPGGFAPSTWTPEKYTPQTFDAAKPFQAPTMAEATADPGYQFALKEGQQALERSASAKGSLLTGGTLKDLTNYSEQAASQQYDKVYGRDLTTYNTNEANRYNAWNANSQSAYQAANLNQQGGYQAAALSQQGAYQNASLALDAWGKQISSLYNLASLASPGQYPGASGGKAQITGTEYRPGMQPYGGDPNLDYGKVPYANGISDAPYQYGSDVTLLPQTWQFGGAANA